MTVGLQIKDLPVAFVDICFSLVQTFLKLSDFVVSKCSFFIHMGTIFQVHPGISFNLRLGKDCIIATEDTIWSSMFCAP